MLTPASLRAVGLGLDKIGGLGLLGRQIFGALF